MNNLTFVKFHRKTAFDLICLHNVKSVALLDCNRLHGYLEKIELCYSRLVDIKSFIIPVSAY